MGTRSRVRPGGRPAPARQGRGVAHLVAMIAAAAVLGAAALAGACGSSQGSSPESSTAASTSPASTAASVSLTDAETAYLADTGTLTVGGFNDYAPFGFVDESGAAVGIAVDYWNLLAGRLGVKVTFVPVSFADQLDGLKKGTYDALEGIFPLPEREQWFAFSQPYYEVGTYMYVDSAHADATRAGELKGLTIAVVKDDSGQSLADAAGLKTLVVAAYPEAIKAVGAGKAQATIMDALPGRLLHQPVRPLRHGRAGRAASGPRRHDAARAEGRHHAPRHPQQGHGVHQ